MGIPSSVLCSPTRRDNRVNTSNLFRFKAVKILKTDLCITRFCEDGRDLYTETLLFHIEEPNRNV